MVKKTFPSACSLINPQTLKLTDAAKSKPLSVSEYFQRLFHIMHGGGGLVTKLCPILCDPMDIACPDL